MATVWLTHGVRQHGVPIAERPWLKCVALLELDRFSMVEDGPKFSEQASVHAATDVMVELEKDEANALGWPPGFYHSRFAPSQAITRLGL